MPRLLLILALLPLTARAADPITTPEATALARQIENAFLAKDIQPFVDAFDNPAVVKAALTGLTVPDKDLKEIGASTKMGLSLANRILGSIQDGGSYRLLRIDTSSPTPVPVFRLLSQGSVNYHRWHLVRDPSRKIRIADIDVFISGEPLSKTMRRLLVPALAAAGKGQADEYVKQLEDVFAMQRLAAGGNHKDALEVWAKLPEPLRNEKALMLDRLQYAQKVGGQAWDDAVADYEKKFPNDAVLELVRINALTSQKKYKEALEAVERLDKSIGDPYFDLLRGQFNFSLQDYPKAQTYFEKLLKWDHKFERAWGGLILLALAEKDYAKTVKLLDDREKATGKPLTPEFIEKSREFRAFTQSAEYQKWKSRKQG